MLVGRGFLTLPLFADSPAATHDLRLSLNAALATPGASRRVSVGSVDGASTVHITAVRDRPGPPRLFVVDVHIPGSTADAATRPMMATQHALRHAPHGVLTTDLLGNILDANDTLVGMLGFSRNHLLTSGYLDLVHPTDADIARRNVASLGARHVLANIAERRFITADHALVDARVISTVIDGIPGLPPVVRSQIFDVGQAKAEKRRLEALAIQDPLTGLLNRAGFERRLPDAIARDAGDSLRTHIFCADLDNFKRINDTWGHRVGDIVLCTVASRLREALPGAVLARPGGDEFAGIVAGADAGSLQRVIVAAIERPLADLPDIGIPRVSVGCFALSGRSIDPPAILAELDRAMYADKSTRGQRADSPRHQEPRREGGESRRSTWRPGAVAPGPVTATDTPVEQASGR